MFKSLTLVMQIRFELGIRITDGPCVVQLIDASTDAYNQHHQIM